MIATKKAPARRKGTSLPSTTRRVAIYTRQSVADDLEFNSLQAQRQAIEAYILSQKSLGWEVLPEPYDDHGCSGGSIERPAFQRLLADVEAGKVDVVAVHRLDRLSRSIGDFVRVMELLSEHGASLVSTTQAFDTGTSLGRMTMNLLATFATYERDMIRERTQEKMAATRRRGMWTGGVPVLGFDLVAKKLVVDKEEADRVRAIFRLYLERGSLLAVAEELSRLGWTTKTHPSGGRAVGGRAFDKHTVRRILENVVYRGKIQYRDQIYDGAHEAIVDEATWTSAQELLRENGRHEWKRCSRSGAILSGIVRCGQCESAMTTHHTKSGNRRYGYYVCQTAQKRGASACPGSRVATQDLEAFVIERVKDIGRDPALVRETIEATGKALVARRPEIETELRHLGIYRDQLGKQRRNLVDAVAKAGPKAHGLLEKIGEVEVALTDVNGKIDALEAEVQGLEGQTIDEADLRAALASFTPVWDQLFPAERARIVQLLLQSVTYNAGAGEVEITFRPGGVRALAGDGKKEQSA